MVYKYWLEVATIACCLGEMLFVLQVSLVATILGNRLALRGPAGSLSRAIEHMARALKRAIFRFVIGLQCFLASIVRLPGSETCTLACALWLHAPSVA